MDDSRGWTLRERLACAAAVAFLLALHGAVPFFMTPTVGQAIWSMGFAQSFANGSLGTIYAHDFGIPRPAAISFGLAGAWPASILIRLGLHPADAYSAMVAAWLAAAFCAAFRIARMFGADRTASMVGAVAWLGMPIVWAHAGYSTLSVGIGLLPFYFLAALRLFLAAPGACTVAPSTIARYFVATSIAVFMDGYTFMMFATGASILLLHSVLSRPARRAVLLRVALPVHAASFALAYGLYAAYVGRSNFDPHPIDFFRGWGLDLAYMAIPTKGAQWLPDLLGMSVKRSAASLFGDESVWVTTFSLPVMLAGLAAWRPAARKHGAIASGVLLVAAFGFYMALGPSLKINAVKPATRQDATMPASSAIMPTGNAWISQELPGFNVMRAAYRWTALAVFALWLLVILRLAHARKLWLAILVGVILVNLPNMPKKWRNGRDARAMFQQIDSELVTAQRHLIRPGETVAYLPWGNDFMANYVAARAGFRTFNIGGDKNLAAALVQWPVAMRAAGGELDAAKAVEAIKLLVDGDADVLVLPYFHMLWAAHLWPCVEQTSAMLSADEAATWRAIPGFVCPAQRKAQLAPILAALRATQRVDIVDTGLFAVIRLRRRD